MAEHQPQEYATMDLDHLSRRSSRMTRVVALLVSLAAVACTSLGLTSASASASLLPSCAARQTSTPFAPWGDSHSYFPMPGGGFESGAAGWRLTGGAVVVNGNESSFINRKTDTHSLAIPSGAIVTSPTVCVAMGEDSIRLFVKNTGVASSVLHVQAYVQNPLTGLVLSTGFDLNGGTGPTTWSPTARLFVPNLLGGVLGTQNLTLVFTPRGAPATWNIDDVYVDPFRSR
jgi:hypothetical protein